jgi:hypothetical protein
MLIQAAALTAYAQNVKRAPQKTLSTSTNTDCGMSTHSRGVLKGLKKKMFLLYCYQW